MNHICQKTNCGRAAIGAVGLNVPAVNCPIKEHDPIQIVLGLELCQTCMEAFSAADFFGADSRLEQAVRLQARGRAEPDFSRAFVSVVSFDSPEWKMLTKGHP